MSFVGNIILIFGILRKGLRWIMDKRYLKNLLGYDESPVHIYQSTFTFKTVESCQYEFVTWSSMESIQIITSLFNKVNQEFFLAAQRKSAQNEMCIGGFINNRHVNAYFTAHFKNFYMIINEKYREDYESYGIDTRMIKYSSEKMGFGVGNNIFLETAWDKNDYAFLIKLTGEDFKDEPNKTVHILFGGRYIGTKKAVEYFQTHYVELYKKYKKNHYFLAIEINQVDDSFNDKNDCIDLTTTMFR